jgi:curved DNA-binding protein CbpA
MGETYYEVLGLPLDANDSQIGQAYRKRKIESLRNADRLRQIEEAYHTLANPISRRNYLKALRSGELEQQTGGTYTPSSPPYTGGDNGNGVPRAPVSGRIIGETRDPSGDLPKRATSARGRPARQPTELVDSHDAARSEPMHKPDAGSRTGMDNGKASDDATRIARVDKGNATQANDRPVRLQVAYQGKTDTYELCLGVSWIGRPSKTMSSLAVPLPDPECYISRQHARVFVEGTMCMITDTSENGTQLNGKWLPKGQPHRLKDGDVITIEGRELTIRFK